MGTTLTHLLVLLMAYLVGSLPFGFLIGKFHGIDIRRHGSGNIGATNVRRVVGKDWGIVCFLLDFAKGLVPVLVVSHLFGNGTSSALSALTAAVVVLGHVFPVYLAFKGGKGVATTLGALLGIAPLAVVVGGLCWLAVFELSRYVSLASICAAGIMPVMATVQYAALNGSISGVSVAILYVLGGLIILRHGENIKRLRLGTENRFNRKK